MVPHAPTFYESSDSDSLFGPVLNGIQYTGSSDVLAQVFWTYSYNNTGSPHWTIAKSVNAATTTYPSYVPGGNGDEGGHRIDEATERPSRPLVKSFELSNDNVLRFFHNHSGTGIIYGFYVNIIAFSRLMISMYASSNR